MRGEWAVLGRVLSFVPPPAAINFVEWAPGARVPFQPNSSPGSARRLRRPGPGREFSSHNLGSPAVLESNAFSVRRIPRWI